MCQELSKKRRRVSRESSFSFNLRRSCWLSLLSLLLLLSLSLLSLLLLYALSFVSWDKIDVGGNKEKEI